MKLNIPPIYPITDKQLAGKNNHLSILKELVRGGAQMVQIRDKTTPICKLLPDMHRCVEFASQNGVTLILTDRCDLVLSCNAMGIHLGQEDLPPEAARTLLGKNKIIGFSTNTLSQVKKSLSLPIQYIGFGPIYRTSTKADAQPEVGLRKLAQACKTSSIPVVAIGGIGMDQIRSVFETGACSAAIISALMTAKSIAHRMEQYLKAAETAFNEYRWKQSTTAFPKEK
jgi:thiamine-phosphate pyrophosphorylase